MADSEISLPPATAGAAALRASTERETDPDTESNKPAVLADRLADRRAASNVEVRRSTRRRRTISAYREGDRTIVLLPARMSRAEEARWIDVMLERLEKQERRSAGRAGRGDVDLGQRAAELSRQFLGGVPKPASVRWVSNQGSRWGSCTPVDGTIRLSDRMLTMPSWVIDYVLVHELAHLVEFGHSPRFYALVDAYPKAERARGYLLGVVAGAGWAADADGGDVIGAADRDATGAPADVRDAGASGADAPTVPEGLSGGLW